MLANTGCYYGHLAVGQTRILLARQPIEALLVDPETPEELSRRLRGVEKVRAYARELGLDVGRQYTSYVPWPGDRVITTVVATRPGEVEAAGFRFPWVGRLPYKGYFDRAAAEAEAASLRAEGLDVCLVPVRAYSTLGWIDDPLTEPMLVGDDLDLSETIFHELVHATAHAPSAADFNEGIATFLGQELTHAFVAEHGLHHSPQSPAALASLQRSRIVEARALAREMLRFQGEVGDLYARGDINEPERAVRRADLETAARERVASLPLTRRDAPELAAALRLGDACVALRGTYAADLARHEELLTALGGDLSVFIAHFRASAAAAATTRSDADAERELRARFFAPATKPSER